MDTPTTSKSRAKPLVTAVILVLVLLLVVLGLKYSAAQAQLKQLSVRLSQGGGEEQNREAAKQVVDRVRRLYDLPATIEPTVATIVDVDALRKENAFYNKAENGDNLVITQDRAILYRPSQDKIIDVVPVQLQQQQASSRAR